MASSLALRGRLASNLLPMSFSISTVRPIAATRSSAPSRLFNTNTLRSSDKDSDESDVDDYRRSGRPFSRHGYDFFTDDFVPFSASRNLSHVLNLMDQISDNPFVSATRAVGAGLNRGWEVRETEDGLHLRFDMPGIGKENVKVSVEGNTLSIKGEGGKDDDMDGEDGATPPRRFSTGIVLPEKVFNTEGIKAEMKNGVLKVVVPKVKEEDRADVFHVKVE